LRTITVLGKWEQMISSLTQWTTNLCWSLITNGTAVRIRDVARVEDSVEDLRNSGYANGKPSVLVIIFRQPNANIYRNGRSYSRAATAA
jgi:multidrug efflux pump subunit AcrB